MSIATEILCSDFYVYSVIYPFSSFLLLINEFTIGKSNKAVENPFIIIGKIVNFAFLFYNKYFDLNYFNFKMEI